MDAAHTTLFTAEPLVGTLTQPEAPATAPLVVLVPGLLAACSDPLWERTRAHFHTTGHAVLCVDLWRSGTESLRSTTLTGIADELNRLITQARSSCSDVHMIAHSFGAYLTLLARNEEVATLHLWDPSRDPHDMFARRVRQPDGTWRDLHSGVVLSDALCRELDELPTYERLVATIDTPTSIAGAGRGGATLAVRYAQHTRHLIGHLTLPQADHDFSQDDDLAALLAWTAEQKKPAHNERVVA